MGITLTLRGERTERDRSSAQLLDAVSAWLRARPRDPRPVVERSEEAGILVAELHPAAEPISLEVTDDEVRLRAKTGTAGPGYHRFVCELATALGDAHGLRWRTEDDAGEPVDPTGWLTEADEAELEEAFLDSLGAAAAEILELAERGMRGFALSLPAGHVFEHEGLVATPLGPRDEAWLRRILVDPREGIDAFPWWGAGGDAAYFRGLALTRMWADVRWRPPITDEERTLLEQVATWIERAHGLDPELELPWEAQSEILEHLGEESLRATRAHVKAQAKGAPSILGYRRRPVRARLSGGWSIRVPGSMAERWEEGGTWVAWEAQRSVWFTSLTVHAEDGSPSPSTGATLQSLPPLAEGELLELEAEPIRGFASFVEGEHEGQPIHRLEAHAADGHHAAIGTLVFVDPADREWALGVWGSLGRSP